MDPNEVSADALPDRPTDTSTDIAADVVSAVSDGAIGPDAASASRPSWLARWNAHWLDPIDATGMILARTLLGVVLIYWTLSEVPGVSDFFGSEGLDPNPTIPWYHITILRFLPAGIGPWVLIVAMLAAGVSLIVGKYARIGGIVAWLGVISMYHQNRVIWNGGDDLLRLVCLYVGLWAVLSPKSVSEMKPDRVLRGAVPMTAAWGMRILRLQLAVVYLSTVFEKLRGQTWTEGTATFRAFGLKNMQRFPLPGFLATNGVAHNLLTWATLVLEVAVPILLFNPKWRRKAAFVGFCFHMGIEYTLRVGIFSWVMMVCYLAFFTREDVQLTIAYWRSKVQRLRSMRTPSVPNTEMNSRS